MASLVRGLYDRRSNMVDYREALGWNDLDTLDVSVFR